MQQGKSSQDKGKGKERQCKQCRPKGDRAEKQRKGKSGQCVTGMKPGYKEEKGVLFFFGGRNVLHTPRREDQAPKYGSCNPGRLHVAERPSDMSATKGPRDINALCTTYHIYIYIYTYVCMYVYTWTYIYIHMCVYIYRLSNHIYIYICYPPPPIDLPLLGI